MRNFVNLKTLSMASVALLTLLLVPSESKADITGFCNPDGVGQCSATVSLSASNLLTITLTNTSPALNGGFITAIAFNLTADTVVNSFGTSDTDFALFGPGGAAWTGSVAPDGTRTSLISATGNDYEGGGTPNDGTPVGATVTFTLQLASANGNTEASIFSSLLVRQRGFQDGGSDKDNLTHVPEPASMLLLGSGLIGFATSIRRRRKLNFLAKDH